MVCYIESIGLSHIGKSGHCGDSVESYRRGAIAGSVIIHNVSRHSRSLYTSSSPSSSIIKIIQRNIIQFHKELLHSHIAWKTVLGPSGHTNDEDLLPTSNIKEGYFVELLTIVTKNLWTATFLPAILLLL